MYVNMIDHLEMGMKLNLKGRHTRYDRLSSQYVR